MLLKNWLITQAHTHAHTYNTTYGGSTLPKKEKTDENSGHYVVASSRPPERRLLERRTLVPIVYNKNTPYYHTGLLLQNTAEPHTSGKFIVETSSVDLRRQLIHVLNLEMYEIIQHKFA